MRKFIASLFICVGLTTVLPVAAETIGGVEYSLKPDKRTWKVDREFKNAKGFMITYALENETDLNKRTEVFAVNSYNIPAGSLDELKKSFLATIEPLFPDKRVGYRILESDPRSVIFEWWALGNDPSPEGDMHGWMRSIATDKGVVTLGYSTRKTDQIKQTQDVWLPILRNAKVVN